MISIHNGKDHGWIGKEYVGRAMKKSFYPSLKQGSPLGNPFKPVAKTEEAHKEVVAKYKGWLWLQVKTGNPVVCGELMRLKGIALERELKLVCWCSPLPCHAEVIKDCLEWMIDKGSQEPPPA